MFKNISVVFSFVKTENNFEAEKIIKEFKKKYNDMLIFMNVDYNITDINKITEVVNRC